MLSVDARYRAMQRDLPGAGGQLISGSCIWSMTVMPEALESTCFRIRSYSRVSPRHSGSRAYLHAIRDGVYAVHMAVIRGCA